LSGIGNSKLQEGEETEESRESETYSDIGRTSKPFWIFKSETKNYRSKRTTSVLCLKLKEESESFLRNAKEGREGANKPKWSARRGG